MNKATTVAAVMTTEVITARLSTPYKDLATLMVTHDVSALPVVDSAGTVISVVSEADLLPREEFHGQESPPRHALAGHRRRVEYAKANGTTAAELMTSPAVTVGADATLPAAARTMIRVGVKHLPVVDAAGSLRGIVSRHDLLRSYVRDDEEIRRQVITEVFGRLLWLSPGEVDVAVHDGVVTVAAEVETRGLVAVTIALVRAVDGVVDVVDRLSYRIDDRRPAPAAAGPYLERP
ncbi:MAG: CBS domain-containing protein [Mycobacteriales bacterium]